MRCKICKDLSTGEVGVFDPLTRVQHVQVMTFVETLNTKTAREVGINLVRFHSRANSPHLFMREGIWTLFDNKPLRTYQIRILCLSRQ